MVHVSIWLLATMAVGALANVVPVPDEKGSLKSTKTQKLPSISELPLDMQVDILDRLQPSDWENLQITNKDLVTVVQYMYERHGGRTFAKLREYLGLPSLIGSSNLIGLHTLLDGAQLEFRTLTRYFMDYLSYLAKNTNYWPHHYEKNYPDLFRKYEFRTLDLQPFVNPPFKLTSKSIPSNNIKHSFANLGPMIKTNHIVNVLNALFELLNSGDLLENFQSIVDSALQEQQVDQTVTVTDHTPAAIGKAQARTPRAEILGFWLKIIGGSGSNYLGYFLRNMLAYNIIPRIISQILYSRNLEGEALNNAFQKALQLADQLGQIDGIKQVAAEYSENAPNYFEFIMLYVTARTSNDYQTLLPVAQAMGHVNVNWLYNCFRWNYKSTDLQLWETMFPVRRFDDFQTWFQKSEKECNAIEEKYKRSLMFTDSPFMTAYLLGDEKVSDFLLSQNSAEQDQQQ